MNPKKIVKLSNIIGIVSIFLLIYWVFVFISIQVFGFKVFQENLSETFYSSIMGILALMFGALIINVMVNLTRIAQKHNKDEQQASQNSSKKVWIAVALSFPLLFILLFAGDYLTAQKKERMLIASAKSIVDKNGDGVQHLFAYSFTKNWIGQTADMLEVWSKTDENLPNVMLLLPDTLNAQAVILGFDDHHPYASSDTVLPQRKDYISPASKEERNYLNRVFAGDETGVKFSSHDGNYELYYPVSLNGKSLVLYFTDFQRYGKFGS